MRPEARIREAVKQVRIAKNDTEDRNLADGLQNLEHELENAREYILEAEQ